MLIRSRTEALLDAEIHAVLEKLAHLDKNSEEYGVLVDRMSKLHKLKMEEHPKRISPDNALVVAANLLGILWITTYERERPVISKAQGFILKPR